MGTQGGVVRLHNGSSDLEILELNCIEYDWLKGRCKEGAYLGGGVDTELQLGLLPIVHGETLHQQGGEPGPGAAPEAVEDEEALEAGALLGLLPQPLHHEVHRLLAHGVVAAGVVVGRVLLAGDELQNPVQYYHLCYPSLPCTCSGWKSAL